MHSLRQTSNTTFYLLLLFNILIATNIIDSTTAITTSPSVESSINKIIPTTTTSKDIINDKNKEQLPVIIIGAGPCGLVVAATLQKHNIPYIIIEKASRNKICSNAGSGFELARTSIHILRDRLQIDTNQIMTQYVGMHMILMNGEIVRDTLLPNGMALASVNRAGMQKYILDEILFTGIDKEKKEDGILICDYSIDSYIETIDDNNNGKVVATIISKNGKKKTITGCALLGCDGIHSKTREIMNKNNNIDDSLNFAGSVFYWGKTSIPNGSELEKEFLKTQTYQDNGCSFIFSLRTSKVPGGFFVVPTENSKTLVWAVFVASKTVENSDNKFIQDTNDSTRRGGAVLTEEGKEKLFPSSGTNGILKDGNNHPLLRKIIDITPGKDITEAYLYDRKNLNLPFSSPGKRVALLGDAAHPQTPWLGQGVNMAISDAYVCGTRIALAIKNKKNISNAIIAFDTNYRRKQSQKIVLKARSYQNITLSSNKILCWLMKYFTKFAPHKQFSNMVDSFDKSNKDFIKALDDEYNFKEQNIIV